MEAFIRFWRFLLRLFLGLLFLMECVAIVFGSRLLTPMKSLLENADLGVIQSLVSSLILVFTLALLGATGLFLLEIAETSVRSLGRVAFRSCLTAWVTKSEFLSWLLLPIPELAKKYFLQNRATVGEYYYLKSWSQPEALGRVDGLDEHIKKMGQHFANIEDCTFIEYADYYGSITQEQVKKDQLRDEIREIYYLLMVGLLASILIIRYDLISQSLCVTLTAFLILVALSFSALVERRRRFAVYIMLGYLDVSSLGQAATMEDRDAI